MKNTFAFIATLSAFALTACGGGGSDSPVSVNPQTNGGSNTSNPSTPTMNSFVVSGKRILQTLEDLYQLDKQIKSGLVDRYYSFELFLINFKRK